jgi:hypothetical protein
MWREDIEFTLKSTLEKMIESQRRLDEVACRALEYPNMPDELREVLYCILYVGEQIRIIHKMKSYKEVYKFIRQNPEMQRRLDRLLEAYVDLPKVKN